MKIKIKFAHSHQRNFIPGLNKQVEKGLDDKTYPGLKMFRMDDGSGDLECEFEGRYFILPSVNFQSLVIDDEWMAELKKKPKKEADAKSDK